MGRITVSVRVVTVRGLGSGGAAHSGRRVVDECGCIAADPVLHRDLLSQLVKEPGTNGVLERLDLITVDPRRYDIYLPMI